MVKILHHFFSIAVVVLQLLPFYNRGLTQSVTSFHVIIRRESSTLWGLETSKPLFSHTITFIGNRKANQTLYTSRQAFGLECLDSP